MPSQGKRELGLSIVYELLKEDILLISQDALQVLSGARLAVRFRP